MYKNFDPIDVLFILLISCYLISFVGIVIYVIRNKKINIKEFTLIEPEKKAVVKKKKVNNSKKTFSPQSTKKTIKKTKKKTSVKTVGRKTVKKKKGTKKRVK